MKIARNFGLGNNLSFQVVEVTKRQGEKNQCTASFVKAIFLSLFKRCVYDYLFIYLLRSIKKTT